MRKSILALVLAASTALAAEIPRPAPELAIHMPDGSQKLLSSYRGKVVALSFMFTTCPHCQHLSGILSTVQKEYAAKGVQVIGSVFNDNADQLVSAFAQEYVHGFPVGSNSRQTVLDFLQVPAGTPFFVPILVFIDRKGKIRSQYIGDEQYLQNPEANVRASIDGLLKEAPMKAPIHRKTAETSSLVKK